MSAKIVLAIVEIFGLFLIGGFARRLSYIRDEDIDRWSKLVLDLLLPMFTFTTIVHGLDRSRIGELWILPAIGLGQVLLSTGAGFIFQFAFLGKHKEKRRTFLHFCAFNNFTYLPVIIFRNLWGDSSLSTLFLIGIGCSIGVWTAGVAVLSATNVKSAMRNVLTPNLGAIIAAILVALTGGNDVIPEVVMRVLSSAGSIAIPLILVLIGATLARRGIFRLNFPVLYITGIRLVVLPVITIPLLLLLPLSKDIYQASVIITLMPVAIATVLMTRRYGGDSEYAASAALVTTIASILTVPLGCFLLLK